MTLRSAESWITERRTFVERRLDRLEAPRLREGGTAGMLDGLAKYLSCSYACRPYRLPSMLPAKTLSW